jgi:hypothetical protein
MVFVIRSISPSLLSPSQPKSQSRIVPFWILQQGGGIFILGETLHETRSSRMVMERMNERDRKKERVDDRKSCCFGGRPRFLEPLEKHKVHVPFQLAFSYGTSYS